MSRLFFALEIACPWPKRLPEGRVLLEQDRHLTLAFLGEADPDVVVHDIAKYQLPLAPVGYFDECLLLRHAVAWHVQFLTQKSVAKDLLAHVTIAREPYTRDQWKSLFVPLPMVASAVHLYESLGYSHYKSLKKLEFTAPIEEFEHTADMAFRLRATHIQELYYTAAIALSFHFPPFLQFIEKEVSYTTLDEIISGLNRMIALADSAFGCPLKAVSYHGAVVTRADLLLEWEMIVDV